MRKTKFALAFAVLALGGSVGSAMEQYGDFHEFVTRGDLKPFARDLGGVLGSAAFHSGRSLGLLGFDLGAHGGVQFAPDKNDAILRNSGVHAFGLPWVQAEVGLPFRLDGFIRGMSFQGLTIAGGGMRYSLFKVSDVPWKPQALVSVVGHSVAHTDFSASHLGLNLVVSMGIPLVTPYLGAGVDETRIVIRSANLAAADPTIIGAATTTIESRFTAGVSVKPLPFTYIQAAATMLHGAPGADMGLGIRF